VGGEKKGAAKKWGEEAAFAKKMERGEESGHYTAGRKKQGRGILV